jgi:NAD-dependent deacetylase
MTVDDARILARWLTEAVSAVAFTGAGISTESGIPDFRSPGGVWAKYQPVYFDDFLASAAARHEYWRQKCEAHDQFAAAQPNAGHQLLADWERTGRLAGVITQNIDGLHQMAGSQTVVELHGTARQVACLDCDARFAVEPLVRHFLDTDQVPPCPRCNGRLKHATISFGQALPEDVLERAGELARQSDLFLAIGSSLVVHPAAGLPAVAKHNGARLVIINRDETPLDDQADIVVRSPIGETLLQINQALRQLKDA